MKIRLSTRILLLAFIPLAMVLAWFAAWQHNYRQQTTVISAYSFSHATQVAYDYQHDAENNPIDDPVPPGPFWFRSWFGKHFFATVVSFEPEASFHLAQIRDLNEIGQLKGLNDLRLFNCENLRSLDGLQHLVKLENLTLSIGPQLTEMDAIFELTRLRRLYLYPTIQAEELETEIDFDLNTFQTMAVLEELQFNHLPQSSLRGIKKLTALKSLTCNQCENLVDIAGISASDSLEEVTFIGCDSIENLDALGELKQLAVIACKKISEEDIERYARRFPRVVIKLDFDEP